MTMPAGKYWIGDLCYVMDEKWDAFCSATIGSGNHLNGEFVVAGVTVASYGTMYGDGEYRDTNGRRYGVDAGLIGCIRVEDVDTTNPKNDFTLGHIYEFPERFETCCLNGVIHFGDTVVIDTDDSSDDDEDYDEDYYEEEEEPEMEDRCAED